MEGIQSDFTGGSLQISSDVIEKIACHATMEVEGVARVEAPPSGAMTILGKIASSKPIQVIMKNDVADIEVSLVVKYGTRIPEISEKVQQNVKDSVQCMTSISVAKVDVVVAGVDTENEE